MTRHPEFTIESPHLDKFLLQPKATARQPQISSLSTSLDCIFSSKQIPYTTFLFPAKQIPTNLSFPAKATLYIQHLFYCFPLKQIFFLSNRKKQKQKANKNFIFFQSNFKSNSKSNFFNFQTAISKVLRPKRKSNLTKALFFSFKKLSFFFPPLLIKIFLPNTALRRQKDLTAVIKYETNISYRNHIFYRPQEHQNVCFPEQHA